MSRSPQQPPAASGPPAGASPVPPGRGASGAGPEAGRAPGAPPLPAGRADGPGHEGAGSDRAGSVAGSDRAGSGAGPAELAATLLALPPSCGPVRLVAVDGHAGSGKSTFAARLAARLADAPVVHLDDLATHGAFFGWTERLRRRVLDPLGQGSEARYEVYDWDRHRFGGTERVLPPAPVVLVEGVGAGRRAIRPYLACLLWMDMPPERSWERGRLRDGPALDGFWVDWTAAERTHFADDPSYPFANFTVREVPEGYEVREGPSGTP